MKTALYSTTALAAASILALGASDASAGSHSKMKKASKVKIGVGGYFVSAIGFADNEASFETATGSSFSSTNMYADSEIYFRGNTRLDNGIRVDVIVQLETDQRTANSALDGGSSDGPIDESYLKFTGGFGDVRVGSTKSALFVLKHSSPGEGLYPIGNPRTRDFIVRPGGFNTGPAAISTNVGAGDNMKIVYITPRFSGLRAGVSYQTDNDKSDVLPDRASGNDAQAFDATLSYEDKIGDVSVQADISYVKTMGAHGAGGAALAEAADETQYGVGLVGSVAGWSVGGRYYRSLDAGSKNDATSQTAKAYEVGVRYRSGPWGVSLQYANQKENATRGDAGLEDEVTIWQVGGRYNIGPGISLRGTITSAEYENEATAAVSNNEGWAAVAGIRVGF
jgi:outer membrane protein OmpU